MPTHLQDEISLSNPKSWKVKLLDKNLISMSALGILITKQKYLKRIYNKNAIHV